MSQGAARTILQHLGLAAGVASALASYECTGGSRAILTAGATVLDSDGAPDWGRDPVVVSLARWDRFKDPLGILEGFLDRVVPTTDAHLLLAGPDALQVAGDPEAEAVLAEVRERWRRLPPQARARVHVACLPLTPPEDNAARLDMMEHRPINHALVQSSSQPGIGAPLKEEAQGHQARVAPDEFYRGGCRQSAATYGFDRASEVYSPSRAASPRRPPQARARSISPSSSGPATSAT